MMLQRSVKVEEFQTQSIIQMESESNRFMKDYSSYECLLVVTAKE